MAESNYEDLERPYGSTLERAESMVVEPGGGETTATTLSPTDNGSVQEMAVPSPGGINDLWIQTFIKSTNWSPKTVGFYIDGQRGYAEFADVFVTGNITVTTGTIGGFEIGADYIRDAANSFGLASTVTGGDDVRFWAGTTFANRTAAPFTVTESGVMTAKDVYLGGTQIQYRINNNGLFNYGDGSDGAGIADGSMALAGATLAGSTYTLTRDIYCTDLTVSTGVTINPNGYRIFGNGTMTLEGTAVVQRNGNNGASGSGAAPGSGGPALADGYLKGSATGGPGGAGGNFILGEDGKPGTAGASTSNSIGTDGAAGGNGGSSTSPAGTGGPAGTATASNVKLIANWHLVTLLDISSTGSTVKFDNSGGAGGGGGGGRGAGPSSGGGGGGGGSDGGIIAVYFRNIVIGASASITAIGGNGGNGADQSGGNGGGGGGGGGANGGQIILVYNTITNNGTLSVSGGIAGIAGTGAGTGSNGQAGTNGSSGTIRLFQLSL